MTMSDLISREDVIFALIEKGQKSKRYKFGESWELNLSEIKEAVESVPSAEPERKHGKWIYDTKRVTDAGWMYNQYHCSECGEQEIGAMQNFCPNCGADMRGVNAKA